MKKIIKSQLLYFLIILILILILFYDNLKILSFNIFPSNSLQVHYIDVDQGDSTLIITPKNNVILIDAGDDDNGQKVINYLKRNGVQKIDILIATHPDSDHIGGIDEVIYEFPIKHFYMPMKSHDTKTFESVLKAAQSKKINITSGYSGIKFQIEKNIYMTMLSPIQNKNYFDNNNLYSIILSLKYLDNSFLFMGDAEFENEYDIINSNIDIDCDILKIGHHGSSSSTSLDLIKSTTPDAAVISAGYKNKFSHPHKEVLDMLESTNIALFRTDEQGTIILIADGKTIKSNKNPGTYTYRKAN